MKEKNRLKMVSEELEMNANFRVKLERSLLALLDIERGFKLFDDTGEEAEFVARNLNEILNPAVDSLQPKGQCDFDEVFSSLQQGPLVLN